MREKTESRAAFVTMFAIITLLYFNFSILRSVRNALVVADGGGAELLPFFELWAGLPAAIALTWFITRLCRRFSLSRVFSILTLMFLVFFGLFAFWIYPRFALNHAATPMASFLSYGPEIVWAYWPKALFFAVSELWKVALLSVLFWSAANRSLRKEYAQIVYGPLLAGGSLGALLAGPVTAWCTASGGSFGWLESLYLVSSIMIVVGFVLIALFYYLTSLLAKPDLEEEPMPSDLSLTKAVRSFRMHTSLPWIGLLVLGDYLAYGLTEVVFLNTLKNAFPDPQAYCHYMGMLTFWAGLGTLILGVFLAPQMLSRLPWHISALVTPVAFLLTSILFFGYAYWWHAYTTSSWAIAMGSVMYCTCRATKYTFFDSTRELAYMHLDRKTQLEGKLVIDGIGGRVGRATSSVFNMGLIRLWGSVDGAAPVAGGLSALFVGLWIFAAQQLGARLKARELHDGFSPSISMNQK